MSSTFEQFLEVIINFSVFLEVGDIVGKNGILLLVKFSFSITFLTLLLFFSPFWLSSYCGLVPFAVLVLVLVVVVNGPAQ